MDIPLKRVGGLVSVQAHVMTASHVRRHSEACSASMMSLAQKGWCVNTVINHIAKLISQQSVALDRWKSAQRKRVHMLPHSHTNCMFICVEISQCLCRATAQLHSLCLLLPVRKWLDLRAEENNMAWICVVFFISIFVVVLGGEVLIWCSLMRGCLGSPAVWLFGFEARDYWGRHCQHIYFATVPACQRSLGIIRYKHK